jgi:transcriptional regulator with XRE-family HTH domain
LWVEILMRRTRSYSRPTLELAKVLGLEIARARRERRVTIAELAERAGTSVPTVRRVEQGDPTVAFGTAFEIGRLVGIQFFGAEPGSESELVDRARERLAVLPARVRIPLEDADDDF